MSNSNITIPRSALDKVGISCAVAPEDQITIQPENPFPTITFTPAPAVDDYKDCIIRIDGEQGAMEWIQIKNVDGVDYDEELRLREENTLVKELYEEYKMAVILAHKGK